MNIPTWVWVVAAVVVFVLYERSQVNAAAYPGSNPYVGLGPLPSYAYPPPPPPPPGGLIPAYAYQDFSGAAAMPDTALIAPSSGPTVEAKSGRGHF